MMERLSVDLVRDCLEGGIPASIATQDADGIPNVSRVSQVHYVDGKHIALSYQFFNKTRRNIMNSPYAVVQVMDPTTAEEFRLTVRYLRTETEGPLFAAMKAKLAGIASLVGMQGVFRLLGADVYRVLDIERVPGRPLPAPPRQNLLSAVRTICGTLAGDGDDMGGWLDRVLDGVRSALGMPCAMILLADDNHGPLYTVASMGYAKSGIGSEVRIGEGVIGVAEQERTAIRITHLTDDATYSRAAGKGEPAAREIPYPGLDAPCSQLAVPIVAGDRLLGVLFAESDRDLHFRYDHEDALAIVAAHLSTALQAARTAGVPANASAGACPTPADGPPIVLKHFRADDSIFVDNDYLIKGVAGAILWKLLGDYVHGGRCDFSNKELRVAPELRLPSVTENLEARLILLQRRLAERCPFVGIEKTGRGRFRLVVSRPLRLDGTA